MSQKVNYAYAAGLYEGEGSVSRNGTSLKIHLGTTDEDVAHRFVETLGLGKVYGPYEAHPNSLGVKPHWEVSIWGAGPVMTAAARMWPYLGQRRRERFADMLAWWSQGKPRGFYHRGNPKVVVHSG